MSKPHIPVSIAKILFSSYNVEDALQQYDCLTLEEAGLEEAYIEPGHGFQEVHEIVDWWSDGEDARDWTTQ